MRKIHLLFIIFIILIASCKERYSPKPRGYLRIDLPEKKNTIVSPENCPFSFNIADYFQVHSKENCWIDLKYTKHNATIHLTYKNVKGDLFKLLEESRNMVYKHTVKADAINEKTYVNFTNYTFGTLYDIKGSTASSVQFHLTDSINNFIRGALYFHVNPNPDSLKPIINYIRQDIITIMETLQWAEKTVLKE
ncbi:MAG: gliding motility lipoprotein GldD [Flavobacteriales bacterium]|nr:gliding motility lipoprotein GldD [Flavobacteriales bacterium]|tara:strand:+ start:13533 stop:14111 length:579 start_codon:yes stop_codon:yes gene_type:complete